AEAAQRPFYRRIDGALDELDNRHFHAVADTAQRHPEGRRGFALAGAGMNDQQPLFLLRGLNAAIHGRLEPLHLGLVFRGIDRHARASSIFLFQRARSSALARAAATNARGRSGWLAKWR